MSHSMPPEIPPSCSLGDVLETLPLDVVQSNIWRCLPGPGRCSLRLTCSQLLHLCDELITSATHNLRLGLEETATGSEDEYDYFHYSDAGSSGDSEGEQYGANSTAWQLDADLQSAFLIRLPRLKALRLEQWPHETDLVNTLRRYSAAPTTRLQALSLAGDRLTLATCFAITSFPDLRELHLTGFTLKRRPALRLQGPVFCPLSTLRLLKVNIHAGHVSRTTMCSLTCLTSLQHLNITGSVTHGGSLTLLSHLVSLSHLALFLDFANDHDSNHCTLSDVSALFALTQLTLLSLDGECSPRTVPDAEITGAAALLGRLTRLCSLTLGKALVVGDAVFAALLCLTRLDHLDVHSIALSRPTPGHLGRLRGLDLAHALKPTQLLSTLLPLLPLRSLTHLAVSSACHNQLSVNIVAPQQSETCSVRRDAAQALLQVSTYLAAAPELRLCSACLYSGTHEAMPFRFLSSSLQPLAFQLRHLVFVRSGDLELQDWAALGAGLPALTELCLDRCSLSVWTLPAALPWLPALTHLVLHDCSGGLSRAGWQRAAAVCPRPVSLTVVPRDHAAPPCL